MLAGFSASADLASMLETNSDGTELVIKEIRFYETVTTSQINFNNSVSLRISC